MWWDDDRKTIQNPTEWLNDIDGLLHAGEEVEEEVSVGDAQVVVTTQRVMVFTPHSEGENVRYFDRPNVVGVETSNSGNRQVLSAGATIGLSGVLMMFIGNTLSLSAPAAVSDLSGEPVPGADLAGTMASAIELIDTLFLLLGVLLLANGLVVVGYYFMKRKPAVALRIAGDDDVELPVYEDEDVDKIRGRLGAAVALS